MFTMTQRINIFKDHPEIAWMTPQEAAKRFWMYEPERVKLARMVAVSRIVSKVMRDTRASMKSARVQHREHKKFLKALQKALQKVK